MQKFLYHFYQYYIKPSFSQKKKIKMAFSALKQIRQSQENLPYLMGMLRQIDPYVFEEVLLLCFKERGYWVRRNRSYSGDGGFDGVVYNPQNQKLLIQAKRYSQAINPEHIKDFILTIQNNHALGGYFIHTGRTGEKSKGHLSSNIRILSGEKLLNFVLGK